MRPISELSPSICKKIRTLYTDIDDTLTTHGRIPARSFEALWKAYDAGLEVVPVTGRPAGWCDHIARMWPVSAVVGENGALAYSMVGGRMRRIHLPKPPGATEALEAIATEVLSKVPGCAVAADQKFRLYDLAIDFCEEVQPLGPKDIQTIVALFEAHGAVAKVSSIHVNGWFGTYDKLAMCERATLELLGHPLDLERSIFVGDSPNDEPMFQRFPYGVGVANVIQFQDRMRFRPTYVTENPGGAGFAECVDHILTHLHDA